LLHRIALLAIPEAEWTDIQHMNPSDKLGHDLMLRQSAAASTEM
jgi:hypothetical protein